MSLKDYEREFDYVRKTYFPRWDRKKEWKLQVLEDVDGAEGRCISDSKTIKIRHATESRLRPLLIHEMAHAAASVGHDKKWQARMEKAAQKAETIGEAELSSQIRKEIESYNDPENLRPTAAIVYQQIEDTVRDSSPALPFKAVLDHVRRLYGMSESDFLKRYRRSQRVFDIAMGQRREEKKILPQDS